LHGYVNRKLTKLPSAERARRSRLALCGHSAATGRCRLLTDAVDKVDDETAGAGVLQFCRSVARLLGGDDIVLAIDVDVDATNAQAR
jgi:hypothetical protein